MPTQLVMGDVHPFEQDKISEFERGQLWECNNGNELIESCTYKMDIWDMMDTLDYKQKAEMLMDYLEVAVSLFPDCKAVWIPSAGKLIPAENIRQNTYKRENRFIHYCVNARFFNITGSKDQIVDTRGLFAMNLPDIQCHYHDLNPNDVVCYVYNIASYIFANNMPIKDGDTIDGLENGEIAYHIQWKCHYEDSIIQPLRPVIDICPGQYAAGTRTE